MVGGSYGRRIMGGFCTYFGIGTTSPSADIMDRMVGGSYGGRIIW